MPAMAPPPSPSFFVDPFDVLSLFLSSSSACSSLFDDDVWGGATVTVLMEPSSVTVATNEVVRAAGAVELSSVSAD
jgi:hypothetical protein